MRLRSRWALAAGLALAAGTGLAGAGSASTTGRAAPSLSGIVVTEHGADAGGEFCADFRLTPNQVRWFFKRARVLDAGPLYEQFNELPCWVRGRARVHHRSWTWEVRAGGTARLEPPGGEPLLLGCNRCDRVLGGKPSK